MSMQTETSAPFKDVLGVEGRNRVFATGMRILALLLFVYINAQLIGLAFVDNAGFLNEKVYFLSILFNTALFGLIVITTLLFQRRWKNRADQGYGIMVFATIAMLLASLFQIHLVGSQNSMHHLLIVAVLLVVSWFLKWREVLLFFVIGNLGLAGLVTLEATGVLTYAPLFSGRSELTSIFLTWRVILGQSINYLFVLIACIALVWKLRRAMETSEALRNQTHQALLLEIEERQRSEKEKERLIQELKTSLEQVQTLRGLLPICAKCKKIRDDEGYWQRLESYIKKHSPGVDFTHGLCPDCVKEIYPDLYPDKK